MTDVVDNGQKTALLVDSGATLSTVAKNLVD